MVPTGPLQRLRKSRRWAALASGPVVAVILLTLDLDPERPEVTRMAAIAVWMAIWWITEAIPLAITALLPIVLFPSFGVLDGKTTSTQYFNHVIFLFLGGFLVAIAMQRWNLHKRIALRTLLLFGVRPRLILLGFMGTTAFLSMWISNTATTMMMVSIVLAVVVNLEEALGRGAVHRFAIGLFLGVAYAASLGGIATLVGTPPNLSFVRILAIQFPDAPDVSFTSWFFMALPISVVMLGITWLLLCAFFAPRRKHLRIDRTVFLDDYRALGPMQFEEKVVLAGFVSLALLWLFRADLTIGSLSVPGWSGLFGHPRFLNDGTVAIAMAIPMFLIPARSEPGKRILEQDAIARLPWHIVLLFGGGFALAKGFAASGLSNWLGGQLSDVGVLHPFLITVVICLGMTFLTELTSNTATTEMVLPVLAGLAVALKVNPLFLMIPATLSCSCAFMLPVATPPNAIVFGTDRLRIRYMARTGLLLNLIGVLVISTMTWFWGQWILGIDPGVLPDWATFK